MKPLILALLFIPLMADATALSAGKEIPKHNVTLYAEPFLGWKTNWQPTRYRESFLYNYNRNNETGVNLALAKLAVNHSRYRGAVGFQLGTYVNDNYRQEPYMLQVIHEARAGLSFLKSGKLWFDLGIMNSYLGFESPVGMENPTLTRSLAAENSPYYLSGGRLAWEDSTFSVAVHYLNGWQHIQRPQGNNSPAMGTEVQWKPRSGTTIAWNTYIGNELEGQRLLLRGFNNIYWKQNWGKKWFSILGLDAGVQQTEDKVAWSDWWNATLILQYKWNSKIHTAYRAEYFQDPAYVVAYDIGSSKGLDAFGTSVNLDYSPIPNAMLRGEYRLIHRFNTEGSQQNSHHYTLSICVNLLK